MEIRKRVNLKCSIIGRYCQDDTNSFDVGECRRGMHYILPGRALKQQAVGLYLIALFAIFVKIIFNAVLE